MTVGAVPPRTGLSAHGEANGDGDTDADEQIADAEHVGEGQPGGQSVDIGQPGQDRVGGLDAVRVRAAHRLAERGERVG